MDISKAGLVDGLLKTAKIIGWVALSGALVAIAEWVGNLQIDASNYILVGIVGLVNALLAGAIKWVTTKK